MDLHDAIMKAKEKDQQAYEFLIKAFEPYIKRLANKYFIQGASKEDTIQEGYLGLMKMVEDYDPERIEEGGVEGFCKLVIKRSIGTAILRQTNNKNKTLNESFSFEQTTTTKEGAVDRDIIDIISAAPSIIGKVNVEFQDPIISFQLKELETSFMQYVEKRFTKQEKYVLQGMRDGLSYEEMGEKIGVNTKAIDNTVQRARKKINHFKEYYETGNLAALTRPVFTPNPKPNNSEEIKMAGSTMKEPSFRLLQAAALTDPIDKMAMLNAIKSKFDSNIIANAVNLIKNGHATGKSYKNIMITEKGLKKIQELYPIYGEFEDDEKTIPSKSVVVLDKQMPEVEFIKQESKKDETDLSADELFYLLKKKLSKPSEENESKMKDAAETIAKLEGRITELEHELEEQKQKFKTKLMQVFELQ
jgi:RNA polymerase sporulation-specific sigma factor